MPKAGDAVWSGLAKGAREPWALCFPQALFEQGTFFAEAEFAPTPVTCGGSPLDIALGQKLGNYPGQALFGDFEPGQKLSYGNARLARNKIEGPVVRTPQPDRFQYRIAVREDLCEGGKKQVNALL